MICRFLFLAACVLSTGLPLAAQTRTVAGRVTDLYSAIPVSTGTVTVKGTEIRDQLRPDGVFVLHVPQRDITLVVRSQGYRVREVTVRAGQDVVLVTLEPYTVQLDPLVVASQSASHPRSRPVSTGRLTSEQLNQVPLENLKQVLQGRIAGVEVRQNSALPGGDLQLRLRGVTTILGSSSPLYIVDGVIVSDAAIPAGAAGVIGGQEPVPGRVMDLNVRDIESIEVLKGAAATALYGSRGSNGVVVVKTKRGRGVPEPS